MSNPISEQDMDTLFRNARSHNGWLDKPVSDAQLKQLYDLMKMAPTSANSCPARLVFVSSDDAKQKLRSCLDEGNVDKSMSAPVVAIIAMDMEFYEKLPKLFPHTDARAWFVGKAEKIQETAFRNSSLQGAYLMMAARSIGLDCGPMSGFDSRKLDELFFPDGKIKSNFICALGYGDESKLYPRGPRLDFDEACEIVQALTLAAIEYGQVFNTVAVPVGETIYEVVLPSGIDADRSDFVVHDTRTS